jgi:hypothetical protein
MGSGKGGKAPKSPDPSVAIAEQGRQNRIQQFTPWGSVQYGTVGPNGEFVPQQFDDKGNPLAPSKNAQFAQKISESPFQTKYQGQLEGEAPIVTGDIFSTYKRGLPAPAAPKNESAIANSFFTLGKNQIKPLFDEQDARLEQSLSDKGLPMGAKAYTQAQDDLAREHSSAYDNLALGAQQAAGQEQSRQYELDSNTRANALNELAHTLSGSYNPSPGVAPFFVPPSQVDVNGPYAQKQASDLAAYQAKQQASANTWSGLMNLGSSVALAAFL